MRRIAVASAIVVLVSGAVSGRSAQEVTAAGLVAEFQASAIFWRQLEIAEQIVARRSTDVLPPLAPWLGHEDRHIRGNVAFVFAALGDPRGFPAIAAILADRSDRQGGQGIPGGRWSLARQIESDRYYAVHLFGLLKDARALPILLPLLTDDQVNYKAAWALGEVGDARAVPPLIGALSDRKALMRVSAILALERLRAKEALPHLRGLLSDNEFPSAGDQVPVAATARAAIRTLEQR